MLPARHRRPGDATDYDAILKDCAADIHDRFGGHHALGGERHDRDSLGRWFERLGRLGVEPEVRFLGDLADGAFIVESVATGDWLRIAELVARYRDLPLGAVDASVVTTAERLGITEIATVDHLHFTAVRPSHIEAFTILP